MFLMWLGEQVTARGVGNGISLIIFAGIVAILPQSIFQLLQLTREGQISAFLLFAILAMAVVIVMRGFGVVRIIWRVIADLRGVRLRLCVGLGACALDNLALHALATVAAAGAAVTRTPAAGAVFVLFLGFAVRALVGLDQGLTVGDRDLVVVGMNFAEGQEAVTIAAILDEGGLQRRLYARDLGEIDIAAQLLALGRLEIKFLDAIAADHDHPGLFRMGRIDQHFVGHLGAHDGERHVRRPAHGA